MAEIDSSEFPGFDEIDVALSSETPRRWGVYSQANLSIVVEPSTQMLWLFSRLERPVEPNIDIPQSIQIEIREVEGITFLAIGSKRSSLLPEFYSFLVTLIKRISGSSSDILSELKSEITAWYSLLKLPDTLSNSNQTGLFGELWFLARLLQVQGPKGFDAWLGPIGELHDFSLSSVDIEVKTTLEHSRIHTISSAGQLQPSKGRLLYLLSIQLLPAGQGLGVTLPVAILRLKTLLKDDSNRMLLFESHLKKIGYNEEQAKNYRTSYRLRSEPMIIPVDKDFPRITTENLMTAVGPGNAERIKSLSYRLSVEGLGVKLVSDDGIKIVPSPTRDPLYD